MGGGLIGQVDLFKIQMARIFTITFHFFTVKPAYKNLVIRNLQAEILEPDPSIYKKPFSLKFEIGSYS